MEASGCLTQICGVLGTCAGGMTMVPALCDFVYMAKNSKKSTKTAQKMKKIKNIKTHTYTDLYLLLGQYYLKL